MQGSVFRGRYRWPGSPGVKSNDTCLTVDGETVDFIRSLQTCHSLASRDPGREMMPLLDHAKARLPPWSLLRVRRRRVMNRVPDDVTVIDLQLGDRRLARLAP